MKKIIISLLTGIGLLGFGVNVIMADALASDNTRAIDAAVPEITNVNCNHIDNDGNGICDNCNINCDDNQKCRNCQWNYYDENIAPTKLVSVSLSQDSMSDIKYIYEVLSKNSVKETKNNTIEYNYKFSIDENKNV